MSDVTHPVQGDLSCTAISSAVTLRAYEVYCEIYGEQPAMVTDGCRGGFGQTELIMFLYARSFPRAEWRKRMDEAVKGMRQAKAMYLREVGP